MRDCQHPDVRTVAIRLDVERPPVVLAQWCPTCGCFSALTATGEWSEPEFPKVAWTRHWAIHEHEALCGNLFGEHVYDPRRVDCRACLKRAAQSVGVVVLDGIGRVLGRTLLRRWGR